MNKYALVGIHTLVDNRNTIETRQGKICEVLQGLWSALLRDWFQHSPSSQQEAELNGEVLHLHGRERFSKRVSEHVFCGAIYQFDRSLFDYPAYEMVADVDVFCTSMVLMILG